MTFAGILTVVTDKMHYFVSFNINQGTKKGKHLFSFSFASHYVGYNFVNIVISTFYYRINGRDIKT